MLKLLKTVIEVLPLGDLVTSAFKKENIVSSQSTGIAAGMLLGPGLMALDQYVAVIPEQYRPYAYAVLIGLFFFFQKKGVTK